MTQYEMRFSELVRHVVWLVPTEREKIKRFINGINHQFRFVMTLGNITGAKFDEVVDSARRLEMVRTQEREEREFKRSHGLGNSSGVPSGGQPYHNRVCPYSPITRGLTVAYPLAMIHTVLDQVSFFLVHFQLRVHLVHHQFRVPLYQVLLVVILVLGVHLSSCRHSQRRVVLSVEIWVT